MEKIEIPKSRECGGGRKEVEGEEEGGERQEEEEEREDGKEGRGEEPKPFCVLAQLSHQNWRRGRGVIYVRGEEIPGTRASFNEEIG